MPIFDFPHGYDASTFISLNAYSEKMVNDLFDGTKGVAIDGGIKDSTHIRKLATEKNSPMPALVRHSKSLSVHLA